MLEPRIPADEARRLAALHSLNILDTPPEERFDRITRIVQRTFEVPIVLIGLVDSNRLWIKSCQGLPVSETPRDISFCGHAILENRVLVVPDALADARFADNPLVRGEPRIRFYAGYPLTGRDGQKLGTLCIIDRRPRVFTDADVRTLSDLAHLVERELNERELSEVTNALLDSEKHLSLALESSGIALWEWDIASGTVYLSGQWALMLGDNPEPVTTTIESLTELTHPHDREPVRQAILAAIKAAVAVYRTEHRVRTRDGRWLWIQSIGKVIERDAEGNALRMSGTNADITARHAMDEALERQHNALRALNEIEALPELDPQNQLRQALALGAKYLQAEFAIVSHIEGDNYTIVAHSSPPGTLQDGQTFPLGKTYCSITLHANDVLTISHMQRSPYNRHPCYSAFGLESYIGAPVLVGGRPYGTVNFSSAARREHGFDVTDIEFVRLLARWVGSVQERHRAIKLLYSTMEMQRVILDGSNYSIISTDPDGTILTFNRAAERMLGYAASEVVRKVTPAIIHDPDEVATRAASLSRELGETIEPGFEVFVAKTRRGVAEELEWTYIHKHGRRIPVLLSVTALRDRHGLITGFLGIASDISARKDAEEAMNRFNYALDNTLDMIFMFDPETLQFVYINRGAMESMGYSREELLRMTPYQVKPLMPEGRFRELIAPLLAGQMPVITFETLHRRKDGTDFPVEISLQLVREPGSKGVFVAIVRDATERKKIERLKNEFISTVSHELRTPLTSIRGSLGLIAGGVVGAIPDKAREMVGIALKNSERLSRLINDFLDIEKIESGRMKFVMLPHAVMPLIDQSIAAYRSYGDQYQVSFIVSESLPEAQVQADAERFLQIMANLLSNAAKFSPNGGQVEVAVSGQQERVRIAVTDHGPGIPDEFHDRIFQKFSQADSSDTRIKGGSGLGLSITKTLVERMGGSIGFRTDSGRGTTFYFDLPLLNRELPTPASLAASARANTHPHILVCEDDPDIARVMAQIFTQAGFQADLVYNAAEARSALQSQQYDAMTLDLMLPGEDGISLIRSLRADPLTSDLPIVVVSAMAEAGRAQINGGFGVVDWLTKPFEREQLTAAVNRALHAFTGTRARILHVEDDPDVRRVVASLAGNLADVDYAETVAEARARLGLEQYGLVILDISLPDGSGWELLNFIERLDRPPPVMVFSGTAVAAEQARQVASALIKAGTSNDDIVKTIRVLLRPISGLIA